jgi:hypothetical protein
LSEKNLAFQQNIFTQVTHSAHWCPGTIDVSPGINPKNDDKSASQPSILACFVERRDHRQLKRSSASITNTPDHIASQNCAMKVVYHHSSPRRKTAGLAV